MGQIIVHFGFYSGKYGTTVRITDTACIHAQVQTVLFGKGHVCSFREWPGLSRGDYYPLCLDWLRPVDTIPVAFPSFANFCNN